MTLKWDMKNLLFMRRNKAYCLVMMLCFVCYVQIIGQNIESKEGDIDSIVYDIDNLPYKIEDDTYIDLLGHKRKIFWDIDTMPTPKDTKLSLKRIIITKLKLPSTYLPNVWHHGKVSLIVEIDGSITNLRIIEGFEQSKSKELLYNIRKHDLPKMLPGVKYSVPVPVEIVIDFSLINYGNTKCDTIIRKRNRWKLIFWR